MHLGADRWGLFAEFKERVFSVWGCVGFFVDLGFSAINLVQRIGDEIPALRGAFLQFHGKFEPPNHPFTGSAVSSLGCFPEGLVSCLV